MPGPIKSCYRHTEFSVKLDKNRKENEMESQKENQGMNGAELASMLKGQLGSKMQFPGLLGQDDPELHLSEERKKMVAGCKAWSFLFIGECIQ